MSDGSVTLSMVDDDAGADGPRAEPHLVFVLCADHLNEGSRRVRLGRATRARFGRGSRFEACWNRAGLEVSVPDPRMSSRHAEIAVGPGGYIVTDLGSKNGSAVNGIALTEPRRLQEGDVLELGHSFFVFRDQSPTWASSDDGPQKAGPLSTMNGSFAARLRELERIAPAILPVLLRGESGVGKEVAARATHGLSGRTGALVAVNCGALPESLIESELFGVRRGAFSGADADRAGLVAAAQLGTLFLDEIGELPEPVQVKLLRVLQERAVTPVGGTAPAEVDFRLVSATHRDLEAAVASGRFRGDLFARIGGFTLEIPPLRDRREDLGLLLRRFAEAEGRDPESITMSRPAARSLFGHPWPFNVRELEKAFALALTLAEDGFIRSQHLAGLAPPQAPVAPEEEGDAHPSPEPEVGRDPPAGSVRPLTPEDLERKARLLALLEQHRGNVSEVARAMGKARMQIHRWMRRYGIEPRRPTRTPGSR